MLKVLAQSPSSLELFYWVSISFALSPSVDFDQDEYLGVVLHRDLQAARTVAVGKYYPRWQSALYIGYRGHALPIDVAACVSWREISFEKKCLPTLWIDS